MVPFVQRLSQEWEQAQRAAGEPPTRRPRYCGSGCRPAWAADSCSASTTASSAVARTGRSPCPSWVATIPPAGDQSSGAVANSAEEAFEAVSNGLGVVLIVEGNAGIYHRSSKRPRPRPCAGGGCPGKQRSTGTASRGPASHAGVPQVMQGAPVTASRETRRCTSRPHWRQSTRTCGSARAVWEGPVRQRHRDTRHRATTRRGGCTTSHHHAWRTTGRTAGKPWSSRRDRVRVPPTHPRSAVTPPGGAA